MPGARDAALRSRAPVAAAGHTVVDWLAARFRYCDAAQWRAHAAAGRVHVNGVAVTDRHVLAAHDEVAFFPPAGTGPALVVPLLLADADVVAVDKPPGAVVQTVGAFAQHTFLRELAARLPASPGADRLEPVHRLDRETSGVLLLARTAAATRALQAQFTAGSVSKRYTALVHGVVGADRLVVDAPIGFAAVRTVAARRSVLRADAPGARRAVTELVVERRWRDRTLLRVVPHTGRTHQIRVHLEHAGHPLVGDKLYGRDDAWYLAWVAHVKAGGDPRRLGDERVGRQLLHAAQLVCHHPRTGAPLVLDAPLPEDFAAAITAAER